MSPGHRRTNALLALAAVLLCLSTLYLARTTRFLGARLEVREQKIAVVDDAVRERLARLDSDVLLSYYVTAREDMPAELAHLEDQVVLAVEALVEAASGRITFQVIDPASDADLAPWLDAHDLEPFAARRVERDGWVEEEVWSSLHIAYGGRAGAAIHELRAEHVPHLISLVVAHLDQLEEPRMPLIAVDGDLQPYLQRLGARAVDVDFDDAATIPSDADIFFWVAPTEIETQHFSAIDEFLGRGGSVVIAASQSLASRGSLDSTSFQAGPDLTPLMRRFGLRPQDGPAFDVYCEALENSSPPVPVPYRVRCIAPNQDFRSMSGQPNGTLMLHTPTTFALDGARLAAIGRRAHILATTSSLAWLAETYSPTENVTLLGGELEPPANGLGAKHPLAVLLESTDPGHGDLVFVGSPSPLSDPFLKDESYAHVAFLQVLVNSLASSERLAARRSTLRRTARVGELNAVTRAGWRSFAVLLVPGLLLVTALARMRRTRTFRVRGTRRLIAVMALSTGGVCLVATWTPRWGSDWTADGRNQLAPETAHMLEDISSGITIELGFSDPAELPAEWRPRVRELIDLCHEFASRTDKVSVRRVDVEDADSELSPVEVTSIFDEVTTVRHIFASLRITRAGNSEILRFDSLAHFEDAEFRILTGLQRASGSAAVHVAVACDVPRLSPAEALLDYQRKGLFAPTGADVFAAARASLARLDFKVSYVDPKRPEIPGDADYLIWLQPRRDARAMTSALSHFIGHGGSAFVAAQHFDVVKKELEAAGQDSPWWPQPQFPDIDELYLAPLGINLVREVLFDQLSSADGVGFNLRAVASGFESDTMLRGLGDLSLPSANRITFDQSLLSQHELTATSLISTSRAWARDWRGGALSQVDLAGSDPGQRVETQGTLLALVEGHFKAFNPETGALEVEVGHPPGSLLLLGCSKAFREEHLATEGARNDHLLQSAVTSGTLGEEHLRILARRPVARGFEFVESDTRLYWRALAMGLGPLLFALFGLAWSRARKGSAAA